MFEKLKTVLLPHIILNHRFVFLNKSCFTKFLGHLLRKSEKTKILKNLSDLTIFASNFRSLVFFLNLNFFFFYVLTFNSCSRAIFKIKYDQVD